MVVNDTPSDIRFSEIIGRISAGWRSLAIGIMFIFILTLLVGMLVPPIYTVNLVVQPVDHSGGGADSASTRRTVG